MRPTDIVPVELRFVDGTTHEPVAPIQVQFTTARAMANRRKRDGSVTLALNGVDPADREVGVFRFLAPVGGLSLHVPAPGYIEVESNGTVETVELFSGHYAHVRLIENGGLRTWHSEMRAKILEDGTETTYTVPVTKTGEGAGRIHLPGPGRYRLNVLGVDGHDPLEVDFECRGRGTVPVDLLLVD